MRFISSVIKGIGAKEALFLDLVTLLNKRIAETTNNLMPTKTSAIGRIVSRYLDQGFTPADITVLTFQLRPAH